MAIDRAAVDHVARLARLDLSDEERERMGVELSNILEHAAKVQELDLDDVPPTSHSVRLRNVMRADDVDATLDQDTALANAPASEQGMFTVPRILEED